MKNCTYFFRNGMLAAFLLISGWVRAATYTATSSGMWSSASTWEGGVSPGSSIGLLDNVIINEGVTVTLDMDVEFTGLITGLQVDGTLQTTSEYMLDMNSAGLSGTGTLDLHSLRFGPTASMSFSGTANIDKLWNNSLALNIASDMDINDTLYLEAGSFNLVAGGALTLTSGMVIRVDDGTMVASGGTLNNTNDYSVMYVGTDKNTGAELDGSGLTDVWVNLDDNDQALSISGDVTMEGTLHHQQGQIDLNGGELTLKDDYIATGGTLFVGSGTSGLHIEHESSLTSNLVFDEDGSTLGDLTIDIEDENGHVNLGSDLSINGTMTLHNGEFDMLSGTLTMENGSEIVIEDGELKNTGGEFDGDNQYSVTYSGSSSTMSGIELSGSGLNNLSIDLENMSDSVEITDTLSLSGLLTLDNGGMAMNGYDLELNGTLSTTSNGWISGDEESDLTFNTLSLVGDTLWFSEDNHEFGMLTINSIDGSDLMVGNDLRVEHINMTSGGIQIWDNELWLNSTGTITGANSNRYVNIDGSGSLVMNVQVAAPYTMYPVGTDGGYSPVGIQQNSGTAGYYKVGTMNGVWSDGMVGTDYALDQNVVNRTWNVSSVNGGSLDYNLMTQWTEGMEVFDFDRENAFIMNYTESGWDNQDQTSGPATTVGDMYYLERENITTSGPFAVINDFALSTGELVVTDVQLYPNPVQTTLNCTVTVDEATTVSVADVTGKVLRTEALKGFGTVTHQVDFTNYPEGVYYVNHTNSKGTHSYKVIKSF